MYIYQELGLSNTRAMFEKAYKEGYAVPALNFVSIEQFNAIIDACEEKRSPVILLASPNLHRQLGAEMLARITQSGVDRLHNEGAGEGARVAALGSWHDVRTLRARHRDRVFLGDDRRQRSPL